MKFHKNRCIVICLFLTVSCLLIMGNTVFAQDDNVFMSRDLNGVEKTESFFLQGKGLYTC